MQQSGVFCVAFSSLMVGRQLEPGVKWWLSVEVEVDSRDIRPEWIGGFRFSSGVSK